MAKPKTIKATRKGVDRDFTETQWNSMVKNNSLYGWSKKSDLPKDVVDKDKQLKDGDLAKLQKQLDDSATSVKTLTDENGVLKATNKKLEAELKESNDSNTSLQKQLDDLTKEAPKAPAKSK